MASKIWPSYWTAESACFACFGGIFVVEVDEYVMLVGYVARSVSDYIISQ